MWIQLIYTDCCEVFGALSFYQVLIDETNEIDRIFQVLKNRTQSWKPFLYCIGGKCPDYFELTAQVFYLGFNEYVN